MTFRRIIFIVFALFCAACNKESAPDCFRKAGDEATEERILEAFERIELRDYIHYELTESDKYKAEITGPKNLLRKIECTVSDGRLIVRNGNTCNFMRSFRNAITVRIYAPSFPDIQNYATGNVRTTGTIYTSPFKIENRNAAGEVRLRVNNATLSVLTHTGVCDVRIEGECNTLNLFSQGVGVIDGSALQASYAYVNNSSINAVSVRASDYLFALIRLDGDIYVHGNPGFVDQQDEGPGQLIYAEE